ncbi:S8 family serine peptidase [Cystobacter fuscus]
MAGHGVVMAAAVEAVAPGVRLGLFEIPLAHDAFLHVTDLAAALARAVGEWRADVVLVAMAHGGWGVPAHLRAILRGCARSGRGGRGALIVCCTGRIDQNRDVHGDSAVLASDDFNAQPWVLPVAACGLGGGWYRLHGTPLGRLGPSVELCAPGELVTFPAIGAADDSSLAAALVAGTAARMVAIHPELRLTELRQLLRATAVKTLRRRTHRPRAWRSITSMTGIRAGTTSSWAMDGSMPWGPVWPPRIPSASPCWPRACLRPSQGPPPRWEWISRRPGAGRLPCGAVLPMSPCCDATCPCGVVSSPSSCVTARCGTRSSGSRATCVLCGGTASRRGPRTESTMAP